MLYNKFIRCIHLDSTNILRSCRLAGVLAWLGFIVLFPCERSRTGRNGWSLPYNTLYESLSFPGNDGITGH